MKSHNYKESNLIP